MSSSYQYSRIKHKSGREGSRLRRFVLLFLVLAILAALVFFVVRGVKLQSPWVQTLTDASGRATSWITERKQHLNQTVKNVRKQVGERDEGERVVNFEFYNTLEDMKSMQVEAQAEVTKREQQKSTAKADVKPAIITAAKHKKSISISQASDLEKDILATMQSKNGDK